MTVRIKMTIPAALAIILLACAASLKPVFAEGPPALLAHSITAAPPLPYNSPPPSVLPPASGGGEGVGVKSEAAAETAFQAALDELDKGRFDAAYTSAMAAAGLSAGTRWEGRDLFLAARAKAALHEVDAASTLFTAARERLPILGDYSLLLLAGAYVEAGQRDEAAETYLKIGSLYPDSPLAVEGALDGAEQYIRLGRHKDAAGILTRVLGRKLSAASAAKGRYLLMEAYEGLNDWPDAAGEYLALVVDYPETREAKDASSFRSRMTEAGLEPPELGHADYLKIADRLYERGMYVRASENYREALDRLPKGSEETGAVLLKLGMALYRSHDDTGAAGSLTASLEQAKAKRDAPEALYWLARTYLRMGDTDRFRETALKCATEYPGDIRAADGMYLLGVELAEDGEYEAALSVFKNVEETYPKSDKADDALWQMGWVGYLLGDYRGAQDSLGRLTASFPDSEFVPQALYWRAKALAAMGDEASAQAHYRELSSRYGLSFYGLLYAEGGVPSPLTKDGQMPSVAAPQAQPRQSYGDAVLARALELGIQGMQARGKTELRRAETLYAATNEGLHIINTLYNFLGDYERPLELAYQLYKPEAASGAVPGEALEMMFPLGYWETMKREAAKFDLDPFLLSAVTREESHYNTDAVSPAGAVGLMQLMPGTAKTVCRKLGINYASAQELTDAGFNLPLGACYLSSLIEKHNGRLVYALAEYNAGPVVLARWLKKRPNAPDDEFIEGIEYQETRNYVKRVLRNYYIYRMLYGG